MPCEPRLFQLSDRFGAFAVEEVAQFGQEDMLQDDVYMLDVGTSVYLWVGSGASAKEKTKGFECAAKYVLSATDGRDKDGPIITVACGNEPMLFTQFFPNWDHDKFQKVRGGCKASEQASSIKQAPNAQATSTQAEQATRNKETRKLQFLACLGERPHRLGSPFPLPFLPSLLPCSLPCQPFPLLLCP